jgi:hypothetical protein
MLSADELAAIETWRYDARMPSRAAAVRELLRRGLAAEGVGLNGQGVHSADFGVLSGKEGKGPGDTR